jgi:hypothetical protein
VTAATDLRAEAALSMNIGPQKQAMGFKLDAHLRLEAK